MSGHPVTTIASRQHVIVKTYRAIARGDDDRAVIDGWHLLHEAVHSGMAIETVALTDGRATEEHRALLRSLDRTTRVVRVTDSVLNAMSPVRSPSGVVTIVRKRAWTEASLVERQPALIVMAIDLQDPGNAGAVVRSAEAGGATGVVFTGASADPWGWKTLRAAMGSTFRVPVLTAHDALDACDRVRRAGATIVAATPRDGTPMYDVDLRGPVAIVIGGEGSGVPPEVLAQAKERLTIPMTAGVESLNAAVATALVVYEAGRQRCATPLNHGNTEQH
jgi:RNA methyltransferase, TrmH family